MNNIKTVTKQDLMDILGVNREGLKSIEKRNTLEERLLEYGYILQNKFKQGRNTLYEVVYDDDKKVVRDFRKEYDKFKVNKEQWDNIGIYTIKDSKNNIYIGSTVSSFRNRFKGHWTKNNKKDRKYTCDFLHKTDAIFEVLEDMTGETEDIIRQTEKAYIDKYIADKRYNVINKATETYTTYKKDKPLQEKQFRTVRISNENYEQALLLLKQHNLI